MSNLRWRLIFVASLGGVVFGALTIFAVISGHEGLFALLIIAGIAKLMAFRVSDTPIRHAFAAGFLAGLLAVWSQAAFLPLYFENNPAYAQIPIPFGLPARTYTALVAPLGGLISGCLASIVAWPVAVALRRWRGP